MRTVESCPLCGLVRLWVPALSRVTSPTCLSISLLMVCLLGSQLWSGVVGAFVKFPRIMIFIIVFVVSGWDHRALEW